MVTQKKGKLKTNQIIFFYQIKKQKTDKVTELVSDYY